MSIYEEFGARSIYNLAGTSTRVGGPILSEEVANAMVEASQHSVDMTELQASASDYISKITGSEAAYVTAGASAGLTMAAAAILAGLDPSKMEELPTVKSQKNQFIISREHRSGYDHAFRLAGAETIDVGMNEILSGAGVRRTEPWEYEAAINERTAGIIYVATENSEPSIESIVEIAKKHELPVVVDAAAQLPPRDNLRYFIEKGADLVAYSGGKAIKGPQSSGILCGKKKYISSVALQSLDMDEFFEIWNPPSNLIDKSKITAIPRHGIGRGFKVAKEEIAGLLVALRVFIEKDIESEMKQAKKLLEIISKDIQSLNSDKISTLIKSPSNKEQYPTLNIQSENINLFKLSNQLKTNYGLFLNETGLNQKFLTVHPMNLSNENINKISSVLKASIKEFIKNGN
jgi:L-seryl-tRNA(Ser) seleniumtransferase